MPLTSTSFQKGHKGYWLNKNRIFSDEFRLKISNAMKGRLISEETKKKMSLAKLGNKHPRWIENREIILQNKNARRTPEYIDWVKRILKRDDYRCMDCGERGRKLEVDHIYQWKDYPRLRFILENGRTLCRSCHKVKTIFERTGIYCFEVPNMV